MGSWPDVPWTKLKYALLPFVIALPLITYPFSKALWLAIDLIYQPARDTDFSDAPSA